MLVEMGGDLMEDDWTALSSPNRTLVLVGRTGNGKSATGNSILGRKAFTSRASTIGVTSTCEAQSAVQQDEIINVVDTPGLFDSSTAAEFIGKEIMRCISLAEAGIHAILLVFSVRGRLSEEEQSVFSFLQALFGSKIADYMIVVFTGGDELEENETLEEYLAEACPDFLKEILGRCENRLVLFDNKTTDTVKKADQVQKLLSLVDSVVKLNNGKPYTDELILELQEEAIKLRDHKKNNELSEFKKQIDMSYDQQLTRITEMVETKLRETAKTLEQQLAEEQAARLEVEKRANEAQERSTEEIKKLREDLERAEKETDELKKKQAECISL